MANVIDRQKLNRQVRMGVGQLLLHCVKATILAPTISSGGAVKYQPVVVPIRSQETPDPHHISVRLGCGSQAQNRASVGYHLRWGHRYHPLCLHPHLYPYHPCAGSISRIGHPARICACWISANHRLNHRLNRPSYHHLPHFRSTRPPLPKATLQPTLTPLSRLLMYPSFCWDKPQPGWRK